MVKLITGKTLPQVWEQSILTTWNLGTPIKTQYDKPEDPPSKDVTIVMEITEPMSEPRIHRCFPGGPLELETYRQEVIEGIHDHWVDPENGKWEYTYHSRLTDYTYLKPSDSYPEEWRLESVDQMQYIIDTLKECPYSRRAQAITWKPWEDCGIHDPACLQRIFCRVIDNKLQMNIHMRSNDAYKAAFMNMYAFTDWQRLIAEELGVEVGSYIHIADSYHIYGSYFEEVTNFINSLKNRTFMERTYNSQESPWLEMTEEAKEQINKSIEIEYKTGKKGLYE